MTPSASHTRGWPGIPPCWTSSVKSGVGTSPNAASRVWFTLSHGILNEVYYPRLDQACTRDMGLIVTDGRDFFSEEKRHARSAASYPCDGVPLYRLTNLCEPGRYRIEKEIIADPHRDAVLQRIVLTPLLGALDDYHLYALLAPHLANCGWGNTGWIGEYKGVPMLFAQRENCALALASSAPWLKRSAGFVGCSDGWRDVRRNKTMTVEYAQAENENVASIGEVDVKSCAGSFVLALGFGQNPAEAGPRARSSLLDGFEPSRAAYVHGWQAWQKSLLCLDDDPVGGCNLYCVSTAVLRVHESKRLRGRGPAGGRTAAAYDGLFCERRRVIPEQIWDASDIAERELFFGRPSGSAMPLVWAHAEYIKLARSLRHGRVFDMPPRTFERYVAQKMISTRALWRFNHKCRTIAAGYTLRIETLAPETIHWSGDDWRTAWDTGTQSGGLCVHYADLPAAGLQAGTRVKFTFYWPESARWEGADFEVDAV